MRGSSPAGSAGPSSHSHRGQGANDVLELLVAQKRVSSGQAAGRGRETWAGVLVPLSSFQSVCILSQVWRRERRFIRFAVRSGAWERIEHETKPQTSSAWSLSSFRVACALPAAYDLGLSHSLHRLSVSSQAPQALPGPGFSPHPTPRSVPVIPLHPKCVHVRSQKPLGWGFLNLQVSSSKLTVSPPLLPGPPRISLLAFSHHQACPHLRAYSSLRGPSSLSPPLRS